MFKVINGHRDKLEQQLINATFRGDTDTLKTIRQRLATKATLSLIEQSYPAQDEPEFLHQSNEVPA